MAISVIKEEERYILRILPVLLKENEQFRREIDIVLSETFVTKNEIQQILKEMQLSREDSNRRFEESNRRFDALTEEMNRRFEESNRRFDELTKEMNRRFEESNRRFDELTKEMNRRFEESNRRFDELTKEMNQRFEEVNRRFDEHDRVIRRLGMSIRTVGARWGTEAEATIRNTLKELLLKELKVAEVSEWKIEDKEGKVGAPNSDIQVDLLIRNGEHLLIEIKSSADEAHINRLYKIGKFYEEKIGIKPKLLFVAVTMTEKGIFLCQDLDIQLITHDELE